NILLGKRGGTFEAPVKYLLQRDIEKVVLGDFNGDGNLDAMLVGDGVFMMLGNADGTFQKAVRVELFSHRHDDIVVGDFNADHKVDFAVMDGPPRYAQRIPGHVYVVLGNGDGTFQAPVSYQVGISPTAIVSADFNGDGKLDLATLECFSKKACDYSARLSVL